MDDIVIPKIPLRWCLLKWSLFLKYPQTISFSFYIKYSWDNVGITFLGTSSWMPIPFRWSQTHTDAILPLSTTCVKPWTQFYWWTIILLKINQTENTLTYNILLHWHTWISVYGPNQIQTSQHDTFTCIN